MIIDVFRILSPLLYLAAVIYYWKLFIKESSEVKKMARISESAALGVHFLFLLSLSLQTGHLPLADSFQAISTFMLFFAILNKILVRKGRSYSFGAFYISIIFALQTISMIFIKTTPELPEILKNVYFEIHVLINLISYAAFASAFLSGIMYVLLFHEIKGDSLGFFYQRIPSLSYIETLNVRSLAAGFVLNSIGLISASLTGKSAWGFYWEWDPKLVAVAVVYIFYGIGLLGKHFLKWKGDRIAYVSIIGFTWIIFSMLVISNYFSKLHSFN